MKCPSCRTVELVEAKLGTSSVHSCPECGGYWFAHDELRKAKDAADSDLAWYDIELWKNGDSFSGVLSERLCPVCAKPLYTLTYDGSDVSIDVCKEGHGIWLDRGEFEDILKHVRSQVDDDVLQHYTRTLVEEAEEVFTGPEGVRAELHGVFTLLGLFRYKFVVQHNKLANFFASLPF